MSQPGTALSREVGRMAPFHEWARDYGIPPCVSADPEMFFPPKGDSAQPAKQLCADCPALSACLDWALSENERFGVWGGKTERERRVIQSGRRGVEPKELPDHIRHGGTTAYNRYACRCDVCKDGMLERRRPMREAKAA